MCANYLPSRHDQLARRFGVEAAADPAFDAEAFPASMAPIIRLAPGAGRDARKECVTACFGMVPSWADLRLARHTYNARTETLGSKPSFRNAYRHRQFCIVPAEAVFEPNYESGKAVRWKIADADHEPLGIAGIWEVKPGTGGGAPLLSFSMLTINADDHALMSRFHKPDDEKRMLVILRPEEYDSWLHAPLEQAPSFFTPYPADRLVAEAAPRAPARKAPRPAPREAGPEPASGSLF